LQEQGISSSNLAGGRWWQICDGRFTSAFPPIAAVRRTSPDFAFVPTTEVRLFDHLVPTGEHLSAMIIQAARLAAMLLPIAKDLRPAEKGGARL
jgi:hypothetical protein